MKKYLILILFAVGLIWVMYSIQHSNKKEKEKYSFLNYEDKAENPIERLEWRSQQKGGNYDPAVAMKAGLRSKKLMDLALIKPALKDAGLKSWTSLGPGDTGGRIRSIAIHPNNSNIIYIGSVAGGIWRTFNGGTTWSRVDDFMPNLAITQIVFNPVNPNIMYASTGEGFGGAGIDRNINSPGVMNRGLGILKSIDGGNTWLETHFPNSDFFWVNDIAIDSNSPNNLYAVTANGAIYKTTNGGAQWNIITSFFARATDVKIDPNNSNNVMVATGGRNVFSGGSI